MWSLQCGIRVEAQAHGVRSWVDQIRQHADVHVNMILVGNKIDLIKDERVLAELEANNQTPVRTQEGQELADEYGVQFFETSAKDNKNVEEAFTCIAKETMERMVSQDRPIQSPGTQLTRESQPSKCCK